MEQVDTRCSKCTEIAFWHAWHSSQVHDGVEYLQCFHSPRFVEAKPLVPEPGFIVRPTWPEPGCVEDAAERLRQDMLDEYRERGRNWGGSLE